MEKIKVQNTPVLMYTLKTTIEEITQKVGNIPNEIVNKAGELGLEITGPQIWQYKGCDGNLKTVFDLEICLPVKELKGDGGDFKLVVLPEFNCISEIHNGPWDKLHNTYSRIMGELSRKMMSYTGLSREIYINCDFENPEKCVTEVQVEIQ